jgi:hypothetical protein
MKPQRQLGASDFRECAPQVLKALHTYIYHYTVKTIKSLVVLGDFIKKGAQMLGER